MLLGFGVDDSTEQRLAPTTEVVVIAATCLMAPSRLRVQPWEPLSGRGLFRWAD